VDGEAVRVRCEHLLLATGSEPVELSSMPFGGPGGPIWWPLSMACRWR
jgi:pyruvate/2-oxoglutarate dehydrogenase complex dihydrolipoamide dehydrogenase (E3) component